MTNLKYEQLRKQYPTFYYHGFSVDKAGDGLDVVYEFELEGAAKFHPAWHFPAAYLPEDTTALHLLFFSLGMVELISYWKAACPPKVVISCGYLSKEQAAWWKKLYFHGLGEFFYVNGIDADPENFMTLEYQEVRQKPIVISPEQFHGCLVPIGGGKDSVVSLEILKRIPQKEITTFSINRTEAVKNVIAFCQEKTGDILASRSIDQQLLQLNQQGYWNGHTPFSAIVAFASVITAYLHHKQYITLSNETSANESTVRNSTVNHQYSKSFQFEQDFNWYLGTLITSPICYFSLLRPLTEIQIAAIFARAETYHPVFLSCNAGSKRGVWCCECPKCLFVYIILSPFLSKEKLYSIFGQDLLEKETMDTYLRELSGLDENKPFECVGTRSEVLACLKSLAQKAEVPCLVERYRDFFIQNGADLDLLLSEWCDEHNVPEEFLSYVREAAASCRS